MDINDRIGAVPPGPPAERRGSAVARATEPGTAPAAPAEPAAPSAAVSLSISRAAATSGATRGEPLSDTRLLERIRERIDRGEFEIDYHQIARGLVEDAVAATRGRNRG